MWYRVYSVLDPFVLKRKYILPDRHILAICCFCMHMVIQSILLQIQACLEIGSLDWKMTAVSPKFVALCVENLCIREKST